VRSIVIVGEHTHENSRKTAEVVKIIYAAFGNIENEI